MKRTKKEVEKELKRLESLSDEELEWECTHCPKCKSELVPDKETVIFKDENESEEDYQKRKKGDGHTYKFDCDCMDPNLRYCVG